MLITTHSQSHNKTDPIVSVSMKCRERVRGGGGGDEKERSETIIKHVWDN